MTNKFTRAGLMFIGVVALGFSGWALFGSTPADSESSHDLPATRVVIEVPTPPGKPEKKREPEPGECTTGCSLAKHTIPPYGRADFARARYTYASELPDAASEALETLLFYGAATRQYLHDMGTGPLSPAHIRFLNKQLERDHAIVSIRMVDDAGLVRVAYGPQRVPIGIKQHLQPVDHDLQPLEFNGTVMRTGVNYLWSRY